MKINITFLCCSNHVLQISDGIETMGSVRLELFGYLVLAWVLVYLVIWKGLQNSGKVYLLAKNCWLRQCFDFIMCFQIAKKRYFQKEFFSRSFGYQPSLLMYCWASFASKHWHFLERLKDLNSCSHRIGKSWRQANAGLMVALRSFSHMELESEHSWHLDLTTNSTTTFIGILLLSAASTHSPHSSRQSLSSQFSDLWHMQKELKLEMLSKVVPV